MAFALLSRTLSSLPRNASSWMIGVGSSASSRASANFQQLSLSSVRNMGVKALIKTNKAAAKRIRVRGSGSVKRSQAGTSHNTGYRKRLRNNRLGQSTGIKERAIEKRMRRLIGK